MFVCNEGQRVLPRDFEKGVPQEAAKVFISQPMRDRDGKEIAEERARIMDYMPKYLGRPCMEIGSYFGENAGMAPLQCLGQSLILMADADVVAFAKGWQDARGCRIEHDCAVEYGIPTVEVI